MFLIETTRMMAGPYLCSLMDMYYANQDILNTIVVVCGTLWLLYDRCYKKNPPAEHPIMALQKNNAKK